MSLAKKNELLFIYKNMGATGRDIICASPTLTMTFDTDDVISHMVSKKALSDSSGALNRTTVFYNIVSDETALPRVI